MFVVISARHGWLREVGGWGLLIGSEGEGGGVNTLLLGSSRPDPNFELIPPSCGLGGYHFLLKILSLRMRGGGRWAGIINRKLGLGTKSTVGIVAMQLGWPKLGMGPRL